MDYLEQIRDEISATSAEESLEKSKAFIIWVLEQYYSLPREEAVSAMTDSSGDKRIDAFIESEDSVKILQCKLFDDQTKEVGEKEVSVFKCVFQSKSAGVPEQTGHHSRRNRPPLG